MITFRIRKQVSTAVRAHKRYTLKELLKGATPEYLKVLKDETRWAREGESVGRELGH